MTPRDTVITALEARGLHVRGTEAQCPSHDDRRASLSVSEGDDGCALLHCHAGCEVDEVLSALGLDRRDLFPESAGNGHREIVATYDYRDESGELLFQVVRFAPKDFRQRRPDGNGGWLWKLNGTRRVLYRLPQLVEAVRTGRRVWIAEGEKDVHAFDAAGEVATCNPGGAGKWRAEFVDSLRGAKVAIIADRDEPGREHARAVARSLDGIAAEVRIGEPAEGKDAADHLAAGRTVTEFVPLDPESDTGAVEPFALALDEFIAATTDVPAALVGSDDEILVPHAGLAILYAKGGKGKTTLTIDAAFHFASGLDWLGFPAARPLRVLLVENEGPREPFRAKLAAKRELWQDQIKGAIFVHTENWGALRLDAGTDRLRKFIERERIELVIGDPLDSLGVSGVGSPEDTREFVELLKACGLFRDVAFWLLHHGRKEGADDELDEISGAWGGRPDAMMRLDKLDGNRARLAFPKLRWSRRGTRPAYVLAFDPESESFAVVGEEQDERDYVAEIELLLSSADRWMTTKEIAAPANKGGIGANLDAARATLESNPDRFERRTGDDAKAVGRHPSSTVWQVTRPSESPESPAVFVGDGGVGDSVTPPLRESPTPTPHHTAIPEVTQLAESPKSGEPPDDGFDAGLAEAELDRVRAKFGEAS